MEGDKMEILTEDETSIVMKVIDDSKEYDESNVQVVLREALHSINVSSYNNKFNHIQDLVRENTFKDIETAVKI